MAALIGIQLRGRRTEWLVDGGLVSSWLSRIFSGPDPALAVRGAAAVAADFGPHRSADRRQLPQQFYLLESLLTGRFDVASALLHHMILPALALALHSRH